MQSSSRAPLLSATLRTVSCWIIVLLGPLDDLGDAPALVLAQRPGLDDADAVADVGVVVLVVHLEARVAAHHLLVEGVRLELLDDHDDGLLHPVADHQALTHLAAAARFLHGGCLGHRVRSASNCTVMARAISLRISRICEVFSTCPVACWRRISKSLRRCALRWMCSSSSVIARSLSMASVCLLTPSPP